MGAAFIEIRTKCWKYMLKDVTIKKIVEDIKRKKRESTTSNFDLC